MHALYVFVIEVEPHGLAMLVRGAIGSYPQAQLEACKPMTVQMDTGLSHVLAPRRVIHNIAHLLEVSDHLALHAYLSH